MLFGEIVAVYPADFLILKQVVYIVTTRLEVLFYNFSEETGRDQYRTEPQAANAVSGPRSEPDAYRMQERNAD
jgi:hypothetical protein